MRFRWLLVASLVMAALLVPGALAHGVDEGDASTIEENEGVAAWTFIKLGAEHMVTGYDHLLFLAGVIFFLYKMTDVIHYVTMFTIGHSVTLLVGVLGGIHANAFIVDAIIGLSVVYKGFDNLGGFERTLGFQPNTKAAVLIFGLFHGFGLATKLQELTISQDGLVWNILSFNLGVELGQILALLVILGALVLWRKHEAFERHAIAANTLLMAGGFMLFGFQIAGYLTGGGG